MKERKIILLGTIIFIIILLTTNVHSAETGTFKASATASTTKLKPEEEVTITVAVSDINMGERGINTLEGNVEYDKNVFEEIKESSIQSLNNWTTTYNDKSGNLNGKFLAVNLSCGVKEDTPIFTIKFKVKKDIEKTTSTKINFKDLTSNDGKNLVNVGTKTVELTVEVEKDEPQKPSTDNENKVDKDTNTEEKPTNSNNNTNKPANSNNNTNKPTNSNNNIITGKTDKTQATTKLPKTGKSVVLILLLVVATSGVAISGAKSRNMRDIK